MQNFMITLLICSVTMSILAIMYMAATPLLVKRYSEKGRYYAWLIIIIGLIIPFRPQWGNAIVNVEVPIQGVTAEQLGDGAVPFFDNQVVFMPTPDTVYTSTSVDISWWQIVFALWLAGVTLFITYQGIRHYRFIRVIRRWSEEITDEQILSTFESLKLEMGITRPISIYLCSFVGSPMLVGIVNPKILLPTVESPEDELRFILKHELVHYIRQDILYKSLVLIATAIHWFNPVVYLMIRAINLLCETSCDNEVVYGANAGTRQMYSETIIGVVKYQSKLKTALSTNFYGGKKGMKNRISSIMDIRKKRIGVAIFCAVIALTFGIGSVFAANGSTTSSQYGFDFNNYPAIVGVTEETTRDNLLREKKYDLEQALQNFDGIIQARIELSIPTEHPFFLPTHDARASVMVQTIQPFTHQQGEAIALFVARNFSELDIDNIEVIDFEFNLLFPSLYEKPQSPYRLAKTLEEVRYILSLQDGSIPVTNIEIPEIMNRQANGIIITEQELSEALALLNEAYILGSGVVTNLVTTNILPQPTADIIERGILVDSINKIVKAAIDTGLNPEGIEIYDSLSFGIVSDETYELVLEEAQRIIALYDEVTNEHALEAAHRLFGN